MIHVTAGVSQTLSDRYEFQPRGTIDVKGKGMETFFLVGPRDRCGLRVQSTPKRPPPIDK